MEKYGIRKLWLGRYFYALGRVSHGTLIARNPDIFEKMDITDIASESSLMVRFMGKSNIVNSNHDTWRRFRKVLSPAFRQIPKGVFEECVELMITEWDKLKKDDDGQILVNVHEHFSRLTVDVLGKALLGYDFQVSIDVIPLSSSS